MTGWIAHGFEAETPEAKARWFQSLPLEERMELFVAWTDFILELNPRIVEQRYAQPDPERFNLLTTA